MDADQVGRHGRQQAEGDRLIVEKNPIAPLPVDLTANDQLIGLAVESGVREHLSPLVTAGREDPGHREHVGTGANEVAAGPRTREQSQAVDDDRLAGSGLARQHIEPVTETDLGFGDDGQVSNVEVAQHLQKPDVDSTRSSGPEV